MSMHDDLNRNIDREIDAVARSLTAGPPSSELRPAVRRRLGDTGRAGEVNRWTLGAVVAAALIVSTSIWYKGQPAAVPALKSNAAVPSATMELLMAPRLARPIPVSGQQVPVAATTVLAASPTDEPLRVDLMDVRPLELVPLEVPFLMVEGTDVAPLVLPQ
jgi:hypothetical protein